MPCGWRRAVKRWHDILCRDEQRVANPTRRGSRLPDVAQDLMDIDALALIAAIVFAKPLHANNNSAALQTMQASLSIDTGMNTKERRSCERRKKIKISPTE